MNHLSYLPHSGPAIRGLGNEVAGYVGSKGPLHFPADRPLPNLFMEELIATRLRQIGECWAAPQDRIAARPEV